MSEKKDNWEKLSELPEQYQHDDAIAQRAIEQIEREELAKRQRKNGWSVQWRRAALSLATFSVVLAVFLPVYFFVIQPGLPSGDSGASSSSAVYYEEKQLTVAPVTDLPSFVQEKNISVKYFNYPTATSNCAFVTDTNEFAYLKQEMLYVGTDGFDHVYLHAVAITGADFDFEKSFGELNEETTVLNVLVDYTIKTETGTAGKRIRSKFTYESAEYYLEIITAGDAETKIGQFVTMLIG